MRRSALSIFFERVIVASLPLAMACHNDPAPAPRTQMDLSVAQLNDLGMFAAPDFTDTCDPLYPVTPVNLPPSMLPDGGFATNCIQGAFCRSVCPPGYMQCCGPVGSDGGALLVDCSRPCSGGGRRPAGLEPRRAATGCGVGDYFAAMAHLEAASVIAFRRLRRELITHGAPRALVAAARRASADEVRHARVMRAFAAAHGRRAPAVRVAEAQPRTLEAMAQENAAEGCVRETYGALVVSWQARAAGDREFAAAMSAVAADETRHAELSWAVDAFCQSRLDAAAAKRVHEARQRAVDALAVEVAAAPPPLWVARVGLPDRTRAQSFFDAARQKLWRSRARVSTSSGARSRS